MKYSDEPSLPEIKEQEFQETLQKSRPYTVVILKTGPRFKTPGPNGDPEITEIIRQHGRRNLAPRAAGLMPIACRIGDGSGVSGVCVFDASTEESTPATAFLEARCRCQAKDPWT